MVFRLLLLALLAYIIISYFRRIFIGSSGYTEETKNSSGKKEKEGNVTVEGKNPGKGNFKKDAGDYVDYEEVD